MATFYNQATLSFNGNIINSNVVTGELIEVLSATKTAVVDEYTAAGSVTYVISIVNAGTAAFNDLTVTDDLGGYPFGTPAVTLYPLSYVDGSLLYYVNGVLQPTPGVTAGPPLAITGITVPAGGNATLIYETNVTQYAPLGENASVLNTVTVSGDGLAAPITATETVTASTEAQLSISKAIAPATVADNGQLTYTFVIENNGTTPAIATDNVVLTDVFDPILSAITVTYDGSIWTEGVNYTYDQLSGAFATVAGQITVPAGTPSQDPVTGIWTVSPGISVLKISGTV